VPTADAYVGQIQLKFENRGCFAGGLVLDDEVLLGAVPMDDMDVVLSPERQALFVNPEIPHVTTSISKGLASHIHRI